MEVEPCRMHWIEAAIVLVVYVSEVDDLKDLGASRSGIRLKRTGQLDAVEAAGTKAIEHLEMVALAVVRRFQILKRIIVGDEGAADVEEDATTRDHIMPQPLRKAAFLPVAASVRHFHCRVARNAADHDGLLCAIRFCVDLTEAAPDISILQRIRSRLELAVRVVVGIAQPRYPMVAVRAHEGEPHWQAPSMEVGEVAQREWVLHGRDTVERIDVMKPRRAPEYALVAKGISHARVPPILVQMAVPPCAVLCDRCGHPVVRGRMAVEAACLVAWAEGAGR